MRITSKNKVWLQAAGYPDAVRKIIENLNGLLEEKKKTLERARGGDLTFFGRKGTFASPPEVSQADINKAVADLSKHVAVMEATLTTLEADLAEFEE
jgi:hypothetical protein